MNRGRTIKPSINERTGQPCRPAAPAPPANGTRRPDI